MQNLDVNKRQILTSTGDANKLTQEDYIYIALRT